MNLSPADAAQFEDVCRALEDGWDAPRPRRAEWLEPRVYQLVDHLIREDRLELFRPRRLLLDRRGPQARPNPFAMGLRIIFARRPKAQGTKPRERMGVRLAYAYRHFVPVPFLAMFLGPAGRRPKAHLPIMPGFEEWIAYHLAWGETDYFGRESYPRAVQDLAKSIPRDAIPQLNRFGREETQVGSGAGSGDHLLNEDDPEEGEGWD